MNPSKINLEINNETFLEPELVKKLLITERIFLITELIFKEYLKNDLQRRTFSAYFSPHQVFTILAILINFKFTHTHKKSTIAKNNVYF